MLCNELNSRTLDQSSDLDERVRSSALSNGHESEGVELSSQLAELVHQIVTGFVSSVVFYASLGN